MRRRGIAFIALILLLVLAIGCAKPASVAPQVSTDEAVMAVPAEAPVAEGRGYAADTSSTSGDIPSDSSLASEQQRMIIRTVNMSIIVEDTDVTVEAVRTLVAQYGGYVASSNRYLQNDQPYATVTVRVPAEQLDEVLVQLRAMAISLQNESSSGEDVTEEYYDLDARITNLKAAEEELRGMLADVRENNGKAEDVLSIYRELTDIRGQIDSLEGRQQYLSRLSALSTVTINISPKSAPAKIVEPEQWKPLVVASRALKSFVSLVEVLATILIYLVILSPVFLVPALIIWLIVRGSRRRRARRAAEAAAAAMSEPEAGSDAK